MESYIRNCVVVLKKDEIGPVFEITETAFVTRLDGYAIIPKQEYDRFSEAERLLDEARHHLFYANRVEMADKIGVFLDRPKP